MKPVLVNHYHVDDVFNKVTDVIAKAVVGRNTDWTIPQLFQMCSSRQAFLFVDDLVNPKAALICRFILWGTEYVLEVIAMASDVADDWLQALDEVKLFAKGLGVEKITFSGRIGWKKALKGKAKVVGYIYEVG